MPRRRKRVALNMAMAVIAIGTVAFGVIYENATSTLAQEPSDSGDVTPAADSAITSQTFCTDKLLSVTNLRDSDSSKQRSELASAVFTDNGDGTIQVETEAGKLIVQGGGENVSILVPPETPNEFVVAVALAIDEVRYVC